MGYTINVHNEGNFLHLRVTGSVSPENVAGYMAEGIARCAELHVPNVLIEEDLAGRTLDMHTLHRIVSRAAQAARAAVRNVAYVNVSPDHDPELLRFAENVATNRSVNVRVFRNVAEAKAWLEFHSRTDADDDVSAKS